MRFLAFTCIVFWGLKPTWSQSLDYHLDSNWAVLPNKLPPFMKGFLCDTTSHKLVDVFYVYPTLLLDDKDPRWNADMQDMNLKRQILDGAVRYQASAWAESGRMYIPYYRQAHLRAYDSIEGHGRTALLFAYQDVRAAFIYYLEHFNQGRAIILAGHSQGSTQLTLLLKEFFDGKPLQKQLIAAYMPGIGIDTSEFRTLKLMTQANEVNGYLAWNTMKKHINKESYSKWYKGKACINAVTWDQSKFTERNKHLGFYFYNERIYSKAFKIVMIDGVLSIRGLKPPFLFASWFYKDFHVGDINLFWEDIRQNAKLRIKAYFSSASKP